VKNKCDSQLERRGIGVMTKARVTIAVCATLLHAGTARAAATPQQKCQVAKLKAQGALQACLQTNTANVILGKADASSACQTKFTTALAKADKKGACRYINNGDGTVSDLNTGLMWEKKNNPDGIVDSSNPHDADNLYTWSTGSAYRPDGTAFATFLVALNAGTSDDGSTITGCFASHCDWRLPTIVELQGIADRSAVGCGSGEPCIDPTFGPTQSAGYWSATPNPHYPDGAWYVGFSFGGGGISGKLANVYIRAVRGGL